MSANSIASNSHGRLLVLLARTKDEFRPSERSERTSSSYVYRFNLPGDHTGGATPVPIPNTAVKPSKANGTALVREWESR
jgi:hypothetical protein